MVLKTNFMSFWEWPFYTWLYCRRERYITQISTPHLPLPREIRNQMSVWPGNPQSYTTDQPMVLWGRDKYCFTQVLITVEEKRLITQISTPHLHPCKTRNQMSMTRKSTIIYYRPTHGTVRKRQRTQWAASQQEHN